ncbi:MAG: D-alanyl-D-alanine carboxypeptidase [Candidatus Nanopelagicales bacterium]
MTLRRYSLPVVAGLAVCVAATTLSAPAAMAAKDPESSVSQRLITNGEAAMRTGSVVSQPSQRALVDSASANARISQLVPARSITKAFRKAVGSNYAGRIIDIDTGAELWSRRSTTGLLPASNMKIVTAVSALKTLGPDKTFTTRVVSLGKGKVAIIGGGDATLSRTGLAKLAQSAAAVINSRPDLLPDVTTPAPYRPATCIRKGKRVKSTKKKPCKLVRPGPRRAVSVFVDDSLYPAPSRPSGWRGGYEPTVVRPVRPLGIDGDYSMDSSANAAGYFGSALKSYGLTGTFAGRASGAGAEQLGTYSGSTLADQVKYMLQVSENNIAEMLFRNVAVAKGYVPNWTNSSRAATEVLGSLGIPLSSVSLTSGSGVSRNDRLTPVALTTILQRVADATTYPELAPVYWGQGMPLAGISGTLSAGAGRFTTNPTKCARGLLRAKTGTLFDTIGLSGLAVGKDGRLKAFSYLVNSRPQKVSPLTTRRNVDKLAATVTGCY